MDKDAREIETKIGETTDVWFAEFYCHNTRCDIREVTVRAKQFTGDTPYARGPWRCPNCHRELTFHWVRSGEEASLEREREARINVNIQRAHKKSLAENGLRMITAADVHDRLPELGLP